MDHEAVRDLGAALQPDAELLAHEARAAVAAGEEVAAHGLGRAGLHGAQRRGDARLVLLEILEGHAPARVDQRVVEDGVAQHRLDHHLAHPHRRLARLGAVVACQDLGALLDDAGIAEAVQLAAGQRGDPRDVEVVLLRHGDGAQLVGHAQPAEQLHRAAVGDVHLGMPRGRGIALDQQAAHAERGERAGERHADRPAAGDQDGDVNHAPPRLFASEALSARVSGGRGRGPARSAGRVRWVIDLTTRTPPLYRTPPHLPIASQWGPSSPPQAHVNAPTRRRGHLSNRAVTPSSFPSPPSSA